jgi:hypothetical protein
MVPKTETSRDSTVGIATSYMLDGQGSSPDRSRDFSLLHNVETVPGVHPYAYPIGTGGPFLGGNKTGV